MIVCTKCGVGNEDECRFCTRCGHKLQSARSFEGDDVPRPVDVDFIPYRRLLSRHGPFRKHFEAWACIVTLAGAVGWGVFTGDYRPLWGLIPVVALLAWLRKL